jgi:hypothetical protein
MRNQLMGIGLVALAGLGACGSVKGDPSDAADAAGTQPDASDATDASAGGGADAGAEAEPGDYRWVRSLSTLVPLGVADGAGGLVVTGSISVPADLGGELLTVSGMVDAAIAGFSGDADHVYSTRHGAGGSEFPFLDDVDADGAPIVFGVTYGDEVDVGQGPVAGGGGAGADGFIGRYGPGAPSWVQRIVGPGEDKFLMTAGGPSSTIYGAGWFEDTTTFNNTALTSAGGRDIVLARFVAYTGDVTLVKQYGSEGRDETSSIATTSSSIILAGMFDGTLELGGSAAPLTSLGLLDVYVAKLDLEGVPEWAVSFGDAGEDRDPEVAVDAAGDIYVAGHFQGQVAFGSVNLTSNGGADVFLAKLRGTDGAVEWAIRQGGSGDDGVLRIAVDGQGRLAFAGIAAGALDDEPTAGGLDAVVASFEASTGDLRWRHIYSTPGDDRGWDLTYGRDGDLYATISIADTFDFGRPIVGAPNPAGVLLRIAP